MSLLITSPDPQDIIALFVGERQHDAHVSSWRWHNYFTGNYHYFPRYSNRIVYGAREPRDV